MTQTISFVRMFTSPTPLSPELEQSVRRLEAGLGMLTSSVPMDLPTVEQCCTSDHFSFHLGPIAPSDLPREANWSWNQSRGKTTLSSANGDMHVTFFKLGTRARPHESAPVVKLWVYNVDIFSMRRTFSFLWCEKSSRGCVSFHP